jgi:hypothetical protein
LGDINSTTFMTDTIPPIPEIPPGLREAAQLTKLIPFVGAGASKLAGCPDWNEFADEALRVFVEHRKLSHAQLDQVKTLSPRLKLSIALALQAEHHIQIDFRRILHRKERSEHAIWLPVVLLLVQAREDVRYHQLRRVTR